MPECVENLEVWQRGVRLVKAVYEITRHWPSEEQYGLTSQFRRAAVSVPTNIAEGVGRGGRREIVRFARVSLGSLYELSTLLVIAEGLGCVSEGSAAKMRAEIDALTRQLAAFIRYQQGRLPGRPPGSTHAPPPDGDAAGPPYKPQALIHSPQATRHKPRTARRTDDHSHP
ncbi:four helix bundle protein [Candidatus Bipolaricaulota bacterium]|nr:four helix bundle protein [Candidatus Bipolaricaulota bacterium]